MNMDDYVLVYGAILDLPQYVTDELPQLKEVIDIAKAKIDGYANGTLAPDKPDEKGDIIMRKAKDLPLDVSIDKDSHMTYIDILEILEQERLIEELTESYEETVRRMIDYNEIPRSCGHPAWED